MHRLSSPTSSVCAATGSISSHTISSGSDLISERIRLAPSFFFDFGDAAPSLRSQRSSLSSNNKTHSQETLHRKPAAAGAAASPGGKAALFDEQDAKSLQKLLSKPHSTTSPVNPHKIPTPYHDKTRVTNRSDTKRSPSRKKNLPQNESIYPSISELPADLESVDLNWRVNDDEYDDEDDDDDDEKEEEQSLGNQELTSQDIKCLEVDEGGEDIFGQVEEEEPLSPRPHEVIVSTQYNDIDDEMLSTISGSRGMEADNLHALLDEVLNVQQSGNHNRSTGLPPTTSSTRHRSMYPTGLHLASSSPTPQREMYATGPPTSSSRPHQRSRYSTGSPAQRAMYSDDPPSSSFLPPQRSMYSSGPPVSSLPPQRAVYPTDPPTLSIPPRGEMSHPATHVVSTPLTPPLPYREEPPPPAPLSTSAKPEVEIEVSQGQYEVVRSAKETLQAVNAGVAEVVSCPTCESALAVVADCRFALCPHCRVMFPMPFDSQITNRNGIGLGLQLGI